MEKDYLSRRLMRVDMETGARGDIRELCIGELVCLKDPETGEVAHEPLHMTHWYPLDEAGGIIDAHIRIETTQRGTCIVALSQSRNAAHPSFAWLRAVAKELHAREIRYVSLWRKDESLNRTIIDCVRV